ncbi:hypothetical protein U9M48_014167 [Paspalum notatum var. saurae]|uniref:Protein kinase domain-containing protein n=1 Tax=Paspalum notatum var. saurae TaxID=547442 RepID=A0AAQ3WK84_PASNO
MSAFLVLFAAILVLLAASPFLSTYIYASLAGFVSIDCGRDADLGGYTDKFTGIDYVPDAPYVDAGENHMIAADLQDQFVDRYQTLRTFPSGQRNCYALPTVAGTRYLLRAAYLYGNYDGKNSSSVSFDVYLGANFWEAMSPAAAPATLYQREAIFVAWAGSAPFCLVNTGHGAPFMSVLELRPLAALYPLLAPGVIASTENRINMGSSDASIRYPDDPYDRLWWPTTAAAAAASLSQRWVNQSTTRSVQPNPDYQVPALVMQTAVSPGANGTALTAMAWQDGTRSHEYMIFLHIADFQNTQFRQFDIYDGVAAGNLSTTPSMESHRPPYLAAGTVYTSQPIRAADGGYNVTLVATPTSVLPPIINALEIYSVVPFGALTTLPADFDAIMKIKKEYGVEKNWMGDPCLPVQYAWDGVRCTNTSANTTRITSLDLSHSNLHGAVSSNFTLLTALQNLHDSSKNTCKRTSSRKMIVVLATSIVVAVLVVSAIFLACFIRRAKRKASGVHPLPLTLYYTYFILVQPISIDDHTKIVQLENVPRSTTSQGNQLQDTENRRFMYHELQKFTDNFKQFIGQGGFGLFYFGHLDDGTEVAVKMRSESSSHGLDEFLAEVQSLTKVHHRNIVSLVGYCWEEDHLALVYEYMSQGNLYDHLRGNFAAAETLNWGTRVQIAVEAAQGCSPPIIHRDVKSSNVLLGQNLQAKIADLGLSRTYLSDVQTHISATAAGTAGYMDPEYYLTGRLTESRDVYSFGVVLLEVVTGEPPMVPGHGHIVQRVKQRIAATGDVGSVADPRLRGAYDVSSMWKVVDTAVACAAETGAGRPTWWRSSRTASHWRTRARTTTAAAAPRRRASLPPAIARLS